MESLVKYQTHIGGHWVDSASGQCFETDNPYTGKPWALIPRCTADDVDRAVKAAHAAFTSGPWPKLTASQRGALLRKLGDLVVENARALSEVEVRDNGKLIAEINPVVTYMAQWYHYYGGLADKIEGHVLPYGGVVGIDFPQEALGVDVFELAREPIQRIRPNPRHLLDAVFVAQEVRHLAV